MALSEKIVDVTLPIDSHLPVWPGDPAVLIEQSSSVNADSLITNSTIRASLHLGTHIDAPRHFNPLGWTIDQIPLDLLVGAVQVVEVPDVARITKKVLARLTIKNPTRLFFKTRNSFFWQEFPLRFHKEFTAFSQDAAMFIKDLGTRLVGIDYLSLDLFNDKSLPAHKIFCEANIVGVEGLNLNQITEGMYQCICLPIKISAGDGAPARVLLFTNGDKEKKA
jgi:arylformamidase